ncbi:hypothetical protein CH272_28310 [Rhodococcus sp. 05-340-1]|uniref:hypothetical protein n=1 Tax=Nocardiaceae TaxID=85025 RepID=UPI00050C7115|nr:MULTISPECIES: hypothetical protein [Rhodococcus]OZC87841.1 hypothetical protein CH254_14955 [Rhodococcus sp. 06-412-2C]OZC96490.1 hypothetical protein CH279_15120 [Rhodococcus sp. 06-412-2B]OZD65284.1 hypothetical protein CH271_19745 [Rhodococcus sp. 05-340-2]OZD69318.1 hypothetical protein CH272_28310 [Rhodococcus sp. 05-340-1]OZD86725.1 hypothetical protein CH273_01030 [Rhodococcus sp. 05-339-2]
MSDDELGSASREVGMVFRVGMQLASRFAEQSARRREQQSREAEQHSNQAAREYSERLRTERIAAETQLRRPLDPQWWDRATPHDITTVYEQAKAWESESEIATQAAATVRSEVHRRYGVDITDDRGARAFIDDSQRKHALAQNSDRAAGLDRAQAAALIADAEHQDAETQQRHAQDGYGSGPGIENEEAQPLSEREARDQNSEHTERSQETDRRAEADHSYDSAARREQFASDMRAAGVDDEAIAARISADICQGAPAGAITVPSTKSPRARKGRPGNGKHTDRERSGR